MSRRHNRSLRNYMLYSPYTNYSSHPRNRRRQSGVIGSDQTPDTDKNASIPYSIEIEDIPSSTSSNNTPRAEEPTNSFPGLPLFLESADVTHNFEDISMDDTCNQSDQDISVEIPVAEEPEYTREDILALVAASGEEDPGESADKAGQMPPPGLPTAYRDGSEEIPHSYSETIQDRFALLISVWCEDVGVSRSQYASLLEILRSITDISVIDRLPRSLSTLKRNFREQFPILPLRKKRIPVISGKLPTLSAAERNLVASTTCWMYFQDPIALFESLARSQAFGRKMHKGMAHFVDDPAELWESHAWASSIRSTSGEFALYPNGEPIFPSDVVMYRCDDTFCQCAFGADMHLGRVDCVGKDFRSSGIDKGTVSVQLHPLIQHQFASEAVRDLIRSAGITFAPNELFLHRETIVVPPSKICGYEPSVYFDYQFQDRASSQVSGRSKKILIRWVVNKKEDKIIPLSQTSPSRAHLEIETYGRQYLVKTFHQESCLSIPYQLFIDGFGLYKNMYRSLMGIYAIPACLSANERARSSNIYPVTLGPHGANFSDVISSLTRLTDLDRGVDFRVSDLERTGKLVVFCLSFLGDMPQQQDNSGFKRPTAHHSCRRCLISESEKDKLNYNITSNGRFHYQSLNLRRQGDAMKSVQRNNFFKDHGLSDQQTPLFKIAPCLNLDTFFPMDPCHSEYAGISKIAQGLLINTILSSEGKLKYAKQLQTFQFPNGWGRLQSPLYHFDSYQLQELARASIIIPLLLRCCLKADWVSPSFLRAMRPPLDPKLSQIDTIVEIYGLIAKSNSVLVWRKISSKNRQHFESIVRKGRVGLQMLLEAAAVSVEQTRRIASSPAPNRIAGRSPAPMAQPEDNKKAKEFRMIKKHPNIHIGLHYREQMQEYAVPNNCNVLAGEDKHRQYKKLVERTNKRDVEKTLLQQESLRRTIQFFLDGSYCDSFPQLSQYIGEAYKICPQVFNKYLGTTELRPDNIDNVDDEEENQEDILATEYHSKIHVWKRINSTEVGKVFQIPVRLGNLDILHPFLNKLREAYRRDYGIHHVSNPGKAPTQWWEKISFNFRDQSSRQTLKRGDFITYRQNQFCRVEAILVHKIDQERVFLVVSPLQYHSTDYLLRLPIMRTNSIIQDVIGLPEIKGEIHYMIPISLSTYGDNMSDIHLGGDELLHCTWKVDFF